MPLTVTALVLLAAVLHATWNALVHAIKDRLVALTLFGIGGIAGAVVLLVAFPAPAAAAWPFLAASAAVHVAYNLLLVQSYRLGEFSQVYPLARGTSPLVVTILAAAFVAEVPHPTQLVGVLVVSAGLGILVLAGRRPTRADVPAVAAAFGTGLAIAAYTTLDGLGVRASGSAGGYTGWLILLECLPVPLYALVRRRRQLWADACPYAWRGVLGGLLSLVAYGLVLWAQTRGALAPIAALRETSIIAGAIIGTLFFHERFGRPRIAATVVVATGIVLLNL